MTESMQNLLHDWVSLVSLLFFVSVVVAGMIFHAKRTTKWENAVLEAIAVVYKKRHPEISDSDHMKYLWSISKKKSIRNKITQLPKTKENELLVSEILTLRTDRKNMGTNNDQHWDAFHAAKAETEKLEELCKRLQIDWKRARGKYTLAP